MTTAQNAPQLFYSQVDPPALSHANMALPLGDWDVVRASLSKSTLSTPIMQVVARKLIEDCSPAGMSHNIRARIANVAGARKFRVAFVARAGERRHVRVWLATGRPASGSDRVDVTFDLRTGALTTASSYGNGWVTPEARAEELGKSWRLYRVTGEIESVVPEVFVSIMTATGSGALPACDGRSGVWLGGLQVDALAVETPSRRILRRRYKACDLADLVSGEILSFLRAEFKGKGGLYQWYRTRYLPNKIGLSRIDREIANFVLRRFGATRRTVEVGAGVAQCSQLLALSGVHVIGIEASFAHMDMMKRLVRRLSATFDSELMARFTPIHGFYPDAAEPYIDAKTIVIVPSLGSTLTAAQEVKVFDVLRPANGVIFGERMFFRVRDTAQECAEMIREIQKRGFGEPEVVFAWDNRHFGFHPDRILYMLKVL